MEIDGLLDTCKRILINLVFVSHVAVVTSLILLLLWGLGTGLKGVF